jgi:phospholipid/cholesterol/gamma-HCH transport system ATP-binding protein
MVSRVLMQNLNFTVNNGEIFVILGGSGCGKSSLLKNLFGLYQPLAGDVWIEGKTSQLRKEQSVNIS